VPRSSRARLAVEMLTPLAAATSLNVTVAALGSMAMLLCRVVLKDTLFPPG
jgi:hypothetical protein